MAYELNTHQKIRVAVTGGSGFIGREVLRELVNCQAHPISLQRNDANESGLEIHHYDLSNLDDNEMAFLQDVDVVIHAAALVHKTGFIEADHIDLNFNSTKRLFEKCKQHGVKKFVFLSTVAVYGLASSAKKINVTSLLSPLTPYARAKLLSENYLLTQSSFLKVSIVRLPLVYGHNAPGNYGMLEKIACSRLPLPFLGVVNKRSMVGVHIVAKVVAKIAINYDYYLGIHLLVEDAPFSTQDILKKIREKKGIPLRLFSFPKELIRLVLSVFGKQKIYEQLFEDLVFIGTIDLPHCGVTTALPTLASHPSF